MKVIFLLYEVEITVIAVMVAVLAVVSAYIHYKKHTIQQIDEQDQATEAYVKIIKLKKMAYTIAGSCIVAALISMAYFTFYKPPLGEQSKVYKEWISEFVKNYGQFTDIKDNAISEAMKNISSDRIQNINRSQLVATKALFEKSSEKLALIRGNIRVVPRGIDFEKRKKLAESIILVDSSINDVTIYFNYMAKAIDELEKCWFENGSGNMDVFWQNFNAANDAIKESENKKRNGLEGVVRLAMVFADHEEGKIDHTATQETKEKRVSQTRERTAQENRTMPVRSNTENARRALEAYGIHTNIIATSYGHSNKGFLAKTAEGKIYLLDKVNSSVIQVSPASAIQSIANYRGADKRAARLELTIFNDSRNSDEANGVWSGTNHILPVLVEYNYSQGQHIPHMIKSGRGGSPASYSNYLYEAKNVDAVNMIVEEAVALK